MSNNKKVKDHLGKEYISLKDMSKNYGLEPHVIRWRLNNGWTLKESLVTPVFNIHDRVYLDHNGNSFNSLTEMCKFYGISTATFNYRYNSGMSIEKSLTEKVLWRGRVKDHLGKEFESLKYMCDHYNVSNDTFKYRINNGWGLKNSLLGK